MSLHTLANHIQSAGRGEDKMLVHMTPGEVHGLQALAKAHGGSLSINPHTGLPEAGFLSSILPMVAGGLLAATGVGAPLAAAIVGGAGTLATGSLQKGLMMGLGAFGGAGLAGMIPGIGAAAGATEAAAASAAANASTTAATTAAAPAVSTWSGVAPAATTAATTAAAPAASTWSGVAPGLTTAPTASTLTTPTLAPATTISPVAPVSSPPLNQPNVSITGKLGADFKTLTGDFSKQNIGAFINEHPYATTAALGVAGGALNKPKAPTPKKDEAYIRPYDNSSFGINPDVQYYQPYSNDSTSERNYFTGGLQAQPIYRAAAGGLTALAVGGPVEQMSAINSISGNTNYPQAALQTPMYSNPMMQRPVAENVVNQGVDTKVDPYTGEQRMAGGGVARFGFGGISNIANAQAPEGGYKYNYNPDNQQFTQLSAPTPAPLTPSGAIGNLLKSISFQDKSQPTGYKYDYNPNNQQFTQLSAPQASTPLTPMGAMGNLLKNLSFRDTQSLAQYANGGGVSHLGDYSDGGRLLRGPGDGVSDSIPASIGNRRPARLADGEFVIPARIVSEIGNGSTEAGARKLYAMMNRVQNARKKSVGKSKVAVDSKAERLLPA
jgi:hypothetical protein